MLINRAEYAPLEELARHRQHSWARQREYVHARSPFYQRLWGDRPPPVSLNALAELPLVDKQMLREDQALHGPFGSYLAAEPDEVARIHRTSGTSGSAMNLAMSAQDALETAEVGARCHRASGLGPGDRVVHCLNYRMWMGGFTDHTTLEATGAAVVPFGVGGSQQLIHAILELGINAISCTPSYPVVLEQALADTYPRLTPRDLGLRLGLFGGEAGLDNPILRRRLEATWGFKVRNANYGVSDVFCNFAGQTEYDNDLHFMALDVLHAELIDPDTREPLPWLDGERGELVLTHVDRDCQPLVRYRTGDLIELTGSGTAVCGRTAPRFRVIGRVDDMVVVRGINAFPTQVAAVLQQFDALSGEYRILLHGPGPYAVLPIEVELAPSMSEGPGLEQAIEAGIKQELGLSARVQLMPYASLPRTDGKTRRVIRTDLEPT